MSILAIANGEVLNCKRLIAAGLQLGGELDVAVLGKSSNLPRQLASIAGVRKVLHLNPDIPLDTAETQSAIVAQLSANYHHIITLANTYGKNFLPRVAALCDRVMVSDLVHIIEPGVFVRPIYAGNALTEVSTKEKTCLTIRPFAFAAAEEGKAAPIEVVERPVPATANKVKVVARRLNQSQRPDLASAKVVISGGRALGSSEAFKQLLIPLADKLNAAIGATRAAVDAGHISNDCQVGQTGKIVAPDLYFAIGISGAIQHLAGMQNSRVIVAINKDPEAPIFAVADYGLVGDLFTLVPELTDKLDVK